MPEPDEVSGPNQGPLPTRPGEKYVAQGTLAAILVLCEIIVVCKVRSALHVLAQVPSLKLIGASRAISAIPPPYWMDIDGLTN